MPVIWGALTALSSHTVVLGNTRLFQFWYGNRIYTPVPHPSPHCSVALVAENPLCLENNPDRAIDQDE